MKLTQNFDLREFVPPEIFEKFGANSIWFVDNRLVSLAQFVRDHFNRPIVINDWYRGGKRKYSGYRPHDCPVGVVNSQHRFGRAMDIVVKNMLPDEIREAIRKDKVLFFQAGLRAIENDTPTWVHLDIRNSNNGLLWVNG